MPCPSEMSGIIVIELKRKLHFRGVHVYFEAVRPEFIMSALNWLKASNPLYKDIQTDCSNIGVELTNMTQANNDDTNLLIITVNNHLESSFENLAIMGQPCDAYFLENSKLNSSVDAPYNRTELQIKK